MLIMNITLESIQLTTSDLSEYSAHLSSSQELYSPTAPAKPIAQFGWRDRWWLNNAPAEQVALNYWFFQSSDEAYTAADEGRLRLSPRTISKFGGHESIYQPVSKDQVELGDSVWQAGPNWLFVRETVVVLVAEIGGQVSDETTLQIARKILKKIENGL
ncbi:hypothetical protein J4G08_14480 [Candidatus Poribacteria bacterium]|nr:hypothetical protein [Candidatus Poribacteria bacterium]